MGFGFLTVIFKAFLWCLGLQGSPDKGSSGFGGDDLVSKRPLSTLERGVKVASTTLFVATMVWHFADFLDFLFEKDAYWLAIPTVAWGALVFFRRAIPMDAEAIGTGLWTLSPYVCISLFFSIGWLRLDIPWSSLLWQVGAIAVTITYGLIRDISKEMDNRA